MKILLKLKASLCIRLWQPTQDKALSNQFVFWAGFYSVPTPQKDYICVSWSRLQIENAASIVSF